LAGASDNFRPEACGGEPGYHPTVNTDGGQATRLAWVRLSPDFPLVVIVHGEAVSQDRNAIEQTLIEPFIRCLTRKGGHNLDAEERLGVVVPHRAQRAALQGA
jgi:hypothetical protein